MEKKFYLLLRSNYKQSDIFNRLFGMPDDDFKELATSEGLVLNDGMFQQFFNCGEDIGDYLLRII